MGRHILIKNKKSILNEIEEFLEYLARANENERKIENLKKKFGEQKYKSIYDLVWGKYTGGLPKKEGEKRHLILYINDNGLKFLEEQKRQNIQQNQIDAQNFLTLGILCFAIFSGIITFIYYYFELKYIIEKGYIQLFIAALVLLIVICLGIKKFIPREKR